mmetsp:Transcript_1582/g.5579  ORF Transcript_1582/g.5579 Transcript_1582/m.5579 type:complete len:529 (-) Transcript_1582:72-1658(-)
MRLEPGLGPGNEPLPALVDGHEELSHEADLEEHAKDAQDHEGVAAEHVQAERGAKHTREPREVPIHHSDAEVAQKHDAPHAAKVGQQSPLLPVKARQPRADASELLGREEREQRLESKHGDWTSHALARRSRRQELVDGRREAGEVLAQRLELLLEVVRMLLDEVLHVALQAAELLLGLFAGHAHRFVYLLVALLLLLAVAGPVQLHCLHALANRLALLPQHLHTLLQVALLLRSALVDVLNLDELLAQVCQRDSVRAAGLAELCQLRLHGLLQRLHAAALVLHVPVQPRDHLAVLLRSAVKRLAVLSQTLRSSLLLGELRLYNSDLRPHVVDVLDVVLHALLQRRKVLLRGLLVLVECSDALAQRKAQHGVPLGSGWRGRRLLRVRQRKLRHHAQLVLHLHQLVLQQWGSSVRVDIVLHLWARVGCWRVHMCGCGLASNRWRPPFSRWCGRGWREQDGLLSRLRLQLDRCAVVRVLSKRVRRWDSDVIRLLIELVLGNISFQTRRVCRSGRSLLLHLYCVTANSALG